MLDDEVIEKKLVDGKLSNQMLWRNERCIKISTNWRKVVSKRQKCLPKQWLKGEEKNTLYWKRAPKVTGHVQQILADSHSAWLDLLSFFFLCLLFTSGKCLILMLLFMSEFPVSSAAVATFTTAEFRGQKYKHRHSGQELAERQRPQRQENKNTQSCVFAAVVYSSTV